MAVVAEDDARAGLWVAEGAAQGCVLAVCRT